MRVVRGILLFLLLGTLAFVLFGSRSTDVALAREGNLSLTYTITYSGPYSPPEVVMEIEGIESPSLELVISPMTSFDMQQGGDAYTWVVEEVHVFSEEGDEIPISGPEEVTTSYDLVPLRPRYRLYRITTRGCDRVTVRYRAEVPVVVGYLETLLLRPYQHHLVGASRLIFHLPRHWKAVTVIEPTFVEDTVFSFDLGSLDTMYGDNINPAYNFVPMGFAVGPKEKLVEANTACGRLIFSYPGEVLTSQEVHLGVQFFEFMCTAIGPLEPYRTFIANNNWQAGWMPNYYQPGLYSYFWQHNRTMDWSSGLPTFVYSPWRFAVFQVGETPIDEGDVTYYHFPHTLVRAWFRASTYFVLRTDLPEWVVRGGFSGYLQERMLYYAFEPVKVYQRWEATYEFYKTHYLGTERDVPLMAGGDHFISYFKSELWAFYANQRILEASHGRRDLLDAIRWLYEKFGGTGRAYSYQDVQEAMNVAANADLSDLLRVYASTTEPLPLDWYFQDDDGDGVPNGLERELHMDPNVSDSDRDGIPDGDEAQQMFLPTQATPTVEDLPTPIPTATRYVFTLPSDRTTPTRAAEPERLVASPTPSLLVPAQGGAISASPGQEGEAPILTLVLVGLVGVVMGGLGVGVLGMVRRRGTS